MQRYNKEFLRQRCHVLSRWTNAKSVEYQYNGYRHTYEIVPHNGPSITLYGKTKQQLVEASQDFMAGFWMGQDNK